MFEFIDFSASSLYLGGLLDGFLLAIILMYNLYVFEIFSLSDLVTKRGVGFVGFIGIILLLESVWPVSQARPFWAGILGMFVLFVVLARAVSMARERFIEEGRDEGVDKGVELCREQVEAVFDSSSSDEMDKESVLKALPSVEDDE